MIPDWPRHAACRGKPQRWWFPDTRTTWEAANAQRAKDVCGICPVRDECLQFAITTRQEYGIWGGFDVEERKNQRRYRVIYCNDCGRRFSWIPGIPTDRPPTFCSSHCRNESRKKSRRVSHQRRKLAG